MITQSSTDQRINTEIQALSAAAGHRNSRARIRAAVASDVLAIGELHGRVWGYSGPEHSRQFAEHFRQVYFENPWFDPQIAPLVHEEADGRITAVLGTVVRPVLLGNRQGRMAISSEFAVDPDRRNSLVALQLLRQLFNGPQDLTVADQSNEKTLSIWTSLGGIAPPQYSLQWFRPLRPVTAAIKLSGRKKRLRPVSQMLAPLALMLDALMDRFAGNPLRIDGVNENVRSLEKEDLMQLHRLLSQNHILPEYSPDNANWVLDRIENMRLFAPIHAMSVASEQGKLIGTFIYRLVSGAAEVIQLAAPAEHFQQVWNQMLIHTRKEGAYMAWGRAHPDHLKNNFDRCCLLRRSGKRTLVHSRHKELEDHFLRGHAFLSGLEGEQMLEHFPTNEYSKSTK